MLHNIKEFNTNSVIDTCSILNLLSSNTLYLVARQQKCNFIITNFIEYELLYKTRNIIDPTKLSRVKEMDEILELKLETKEISKYDIELSDLLDPIFMIHKKFKSIGELTAIVLAKKFNIGVVTDDKQAQRIAKDYLNEQKVDSIPSLISWLFYNGHLGDSDKDRIINQQDFFFRNQKIKVEQAYLRALEERLVSI